jgi:RNA polymerase sigma-70 factor, ECF subfamily
MAVMASVQATAMTQRTNVEWLAGLKDGNEAALADLRTYLLRAALFTLQRARHHVGHLGSAALGQLAEDCAQYTFAVNTALVAARRERWASVPLDRILDGTETPSLTTAEHGGGLDPERRALQAEAIAAIRDGIEHHLTVKQQQLLRAVVFEQVPLDEVVRHWGSNRNALYKLLHDARRKLKSHLLTRGFDVDEMLDLFATRA